MDEYYKGHHIKSTAKAIPQGGGWLAHVVIRWGTNSADEQFVRFDVKLFANEVDAELGGVKFARNWIDAMRRV